MLCWLRIQVLFRRFAKKWIEKEDESKSRSG
jgi:hypothetical protein